MNELEFLSPDRAEPWNGAEPELRSPLAHALARAGRHPAVEDISLAYGKVEIRPALDGASLGAEVVRITPERALVLCPYERCAEVRAELYDRCSTVVDLTAALAGLRLEGLSLLRRLTDLDLDRLPAVGSVAHVQGLVVGDGNASFRLFFAQEYGDYMADVVVDAARGVA